MYYLIGKNADTNSLPSKSHVYDVSCSRGKILESLQMFLEASKQEKAEIQYEVIETNGEEFHEQFFRTFSIFYEKETILNVKSFVDYIKGKAKEEEEEDYEGSALEIIDTICAGISPLKDLQDHLYFFINDFLNEKDVDKKGAKYIACRLRAFLKTFDKLIYTVIDTLNDAIDLTEKRDGKG